VRDVTPLRRCLTLQVVDLPDTATNCEVLAVLPDLRKMNGAPAYQGRSAGSGGSD